jgi:transcriptional regulator with XRE-family HTH domain
VQASAKTQSGVAGFVSDRKRRLVDMASWSMRRAVPDESRTLCPQPASSYVILEQPAIFYMECCEAGGHSGCMSNREQIRQRVAAALRSARKAKKLTQEQLAAEAGCSVETLSNAERAASLPGLELFLELVSLLDIDLGMLAEGSSRRRPSKNRIAMEAQAHALARSLSDDRLKLWLETGKVFERD